MSLLEGGALAVNTVQNAAVSPPLQPRPQDLGLASGLSSPDVAALHSWRDGVEQLPQQQRESLPSVRQLSCCPLRAVPDRVAYLGRHRPLHIDSASNACYAWVAYAHRCS
jgi:hypothetical protein